MSEKYFNLIGPKIRKLRFDRNWTQGKLAHKLQMLGWDLSRSGVGKIESQLVRVTEFELFYLASALNVLVIELLPDIELGKEVHQAIEKKRHKNGRMPVTLEPYKRVDRD